MPNASIFSVKPRQQSGLVSLAAVLFLITAAIFVLVQAVSISSTTFFGNQVQNESISAFYLAESGLEAAQARLQNEASPTTKTACTSLSNIAFANPPLGAGSSGSITLVGKPLPTTCTDTDKNCTSCTVTVAATVGSSTRELTRAFNLATEGVAGGGAAGCGGANFVDTTNCLKMGAAPEDFASTISQKIGVPVVPVVVVSNLAYLRNTPKVANSVNTSTSCVSVNSDDPAQSPVNCVAQWNIESDTSNSTNVVGSRGIAASLPAVGTYFVNEQLTEDSFFADAGAGFNKLASAASLDIVGSYWDDFNNYTVSTGGSARTNNGAVCPIPTSDPLYSTLDLATLCPANSSASLTLNVGSLQQGRSWCHQADTLVMGFSGRSDNNARGALTSFSLGGSPSSVPVVGAVAEFPKTGSFSYLYSTLQYLYNPDYLSTQDVTTGGVGTAYAGYRRVFNIVKQSPTNGYLEITEISGPPIVNGSANGFTLVKGKELVSGKNADTVLTFCTTPFAGKTCGTGGLGVYTFNTDAYSVSNANQNSVTTGTLTSTSNILVVTASSKPFFENGDTVSWDGFVDGSKQAVISHCTGSVTLADGSTLACGTGGTGAYVLPTASYFASSAVTSNGTAVSTAGGIPSDLSNTFLARRWTPSGSGLLAAGTKAAAKLVGDHTEVKFRLSQRTSKPLAGAQLCGGICAFFDHSSASALTNLTVNTTNTVHWAAGFTCLRGVDKNAIKKLIVGDSVNPSAWYQTVK